MSYGHLITPLKIAIGLALLTSLGPFASSISAQRNTLNLQYYDEQFIHFGFALGLHASRYHLRYHDEYLSSDFNHLHSIHVPNSFGFQVGFITNMHLMEAIDLRVIPTVGFYENRLEFRYVETPHIRQRLEYTRLELPVLIKYTSFRRRNTRMYLIAGPSMSFRASSRKAEDLLPDEEFFKTKRWGLAAETGVGFDLFNPFFKLSIELRHQWGLHDALDHNASSQWARPIESLKVRNLSLYMTFEGSP